MLRDFFFSAVVSIGFPRSISTGLIQLEVSITRPSWYGKWWWEETERETMGKAESIIAFCDYVKSSKTSMVPHFICCSSIYLYSFFFNSLTSMCTHNSPML